MAQHYNPRISNAADLIFYLDAVNTKSYSGSDSTWYDVSGNNNHFTLFNTPTYTQNGTTGTYLTFNGTNQYARSANAINFNNYSAVTIEIGYRTTVTNATQILYETTGTGSTATGGITLLMNSDNTSTSANIYLSMWQGYGPRLFGYTVTTTTIFNCITETFVNGVDSTGRQTIINQSTSTFFTNTSVTSLLTTTTTGLSFANTWTYVASRAGTSNFFRGDIAYVRAWGTKLSDQIRNSNFNVTSLRQPESYQAEVITTSAPGSGIFVFTTYTFTNASATGISGPSLAQCQSAYAGQSWLALYFTASGGVQSWTVPATASYTIDIAGARGGYDTAYSTTQSRIGYGARVQGTITLTAGTVLNFVVGQQGGDVSSSSYGGGGGGGGTFLYTGAVSGAGLIAAAGGGGGGGVSGSYTAANGGGSATDMHGLAGTSGGNGLCDASYDGNPGLGGTSGGGGQSGGSGWASDENTGGGAGWLTAGQAQSGLTARTAVRGGIFTGGSLLSIGGVGGFGGGGATSYVSSNFAGGGGGGGYSGGGGAGWNSSSGNTTWPNGSASGGGGGSYIVGSATSTTLTAGYNNGHGYVKITKL